ncbi:MAG: DUF4097 family beta strand repeat-containing protein [Anaerobutyricum sp.]|nr:DUF4097 family beta strand repeat-containing protein [Anaerobutyricum sp.]
MQDNNNNNNNDSFDFSEILSKGPDNCLILDVSSVKTLQIGYQAETLFLHKATDEKLTIKEYINGLSGSEYYAKVNANRFKTTIRYGRREEVNKNTCVEIYIPDSFKNELLLSTQYGSIFTDTDWKTDRFVAETTEGSILLNTVTAPRIRLVTSVSPIHILCSRGFTDIHSVSGPIFADQIDGGARLATSSGPIRATFLSLDNVLECETLNGDIELTLPEHSGMKVDGVSKRGEIFCDMNGLSIKTKPGNVKNISGSIGSKPFQNVRISTINGNITLN